MIKYQSLLTTSHTIFLTEWYEDFHIVTDIEKHKNLRRFPYRFYNDLNAEPFWILPWSSSNLTLVRREKTKSTA